MKTKNARADIGKNFQVTSTIKKYRTTPELKYKKRFEPVSFNFDIRLNSSSPIIKKAKNTMANAIGPRKIDPTMRAANTNPEILLIINFFKVRCVFQ